VRANGVRLTLGGRLYPAGKINFGLSGPGMSNNLQLTLRATFITSQRDKLWFIGAAGVRLTPRGTFITSRRDRIWFIGPTRLPLGGIWPPGDTPSFMNDDEHVGITEPTRYQSHSLFLRRQDGRCAAHCHTGKIVLALSAIDAQFVVSYLSVRHG
jgi:hypothetical protein